MGKTLVAVFDGQTEARQALDALSKGGFPSSKARLTAREDVQESFGEKVAHFFGFGEQHDATYGEAVRRGGYVLVVDASDDAEAERASDIIERYRPVDIEQRQAQWRQSGWQPKPAQSGEATLPVVEEQLQVGKREVQHGGIRVLSRTVERPVEETVQLREERASVQRRPADRAPTDADQAFKERTFEVRETAEEDTVRKTDVEVEQLPHGGQERRRSSASYTGVERRGA